ncbi:Arc/MetJ-type ribon-helix-helix transcriptional regulator [Azospirillum soli]|nr:Arc/MetJ-type ribon-helix-helix transcriptional regulator [Azospirillum soli]
MLDILVQSRRNKSASDVVRTGVHLRKRAKPLDGAAVHEQPQSR